MLGCWPLACFWRGNRRPGDCPPSRGCLARGCFAFFIGPCARGCFTFRAVFARHVGRRLPRGARAQGRASRAGHGSSESDTESEDGRNGFSPSGVDEDGVRAAMSSVYIDCDVLLRSSLLPVRKHSDYSEPFSIVAGAEGLPNSPEPFFVARQEACKQRVWLVVNLQHPESMLCEKFNSEVWSQPQFCEDVFANKAKLWQRDVCHFQAEQFIVYYFSGKTPTPEECPLVMILDPRTGRALRRWKAGSEDFPLDPEKALERMDTFFINHTLEGFSPPESPQHSPKTSPEMQADPPPYEPPEICLEDFEEIDVTEAVLGDEVAMTEDGQSSICGPFWDIVETQSSGSSSPAGPFCTKINFGGSPLPVAPAAMTASPSCASGEVLPRR